MREQAKFRGFNDGWHYGHYVRQARALINGGIVVSLSQAEIADFIIYSVDGKLHIVEVMPESVGQYTGKNAVDGTEIYESNIVRSGNGRKWVVKFGEFFYTLPGMRLEGYGFYLEPVGVEEYIQKYGCLYMTDDLEIVGDEFILN